MVNIDEGEEREGYVPSDNLLLEQELGDLLDILPVLSQKLSCPLMCVPGS